MINKVVEIIKKQRTSRLNIKRQQKKKIKWMKKKKTYDRI